MPSRKNFPNVNFKKIVKEGLEKKGYTIDEISPKNAKSDIKQEQFRNKSVWHYKEEIDNYVAEKLNIKSDKKIMRNTERDIQDWIYYKVAGVISELRNNGEIIDWYHGKDGVWRYVPSIVIISEMPKFYVKFYLVLLTCLKKIRDGLQYLISMPTKQR